MTTKCLLTNIWRWNATAGYWALVRDAYPENVARWLGILSGDEPGTVFKASRKRPVKAPAANVAAAQVGVERRAASVAAMVKVGVDQPHDHARLASDIAALDALHGAPLVTTRAMALSVLCDDIEQAEGLTAANQVVLNVLTREGRALPHHHARLAFDNAAIDIMWHQHAALLGNNLEDRA